VSQSKLEELKYVFSPRSIAVFGATTDKVLKLNTANLFIRAKRAAIALERVYRYYQWRKKRV